MWKNEWPTEPGFYWFFGWQWDKEPGKRPPKWSVVQVIEGIRYVSNSHFMYKAESHPGKWHPILQPSEPDLMDLLLEKK